jgi:hypothetical protein
MIFVLNTCSGMDLFASEWRPSEYVRYRKRPVCLSTCELHKMGAAPRSWVIRSLIVSSCNNSVAMYSLFAWNLPFLEFLVFVNTLTPALHFRYHSKPRTHVQWRFTAHYCTVNRQLYSAKYVFQQKQDVLCEINICCNSTLYKIVIPLHSFVYLRLL